MSWDYRVVRRRGQNPDGSPWERLAIHEVYYDDDHKPNGCTVEPDAVETFDYDVGPANIDDLRWHLEKMTRALELPVLEYDDFGKAGAAPEPGGSDDV